LLAQTVVDRGTTNGIRPFITVLAAGAGYSHYSRGDSEVDGYLGMPNN